MKNSVQFRPEKVDAVQLFLDARVKNGEKLKIRPKKVDEWPVLKTKVDEKNVVLSMV